MKIIKEGKLPEEKVYQITCPYCETVFEFQQKEGKISSDQREGTWIEIRCPFCGQRVIHDL